MTDGQIDPVGLDDPAPVFSWKMRACAIGQRQTAYRLTVKDGSAAVWDSGKVETDASLGIVYGGTALRSSTAYTWQVQVWDQDGKAAMSSEATFEMALLEKDAFADTCFISLPPEMQGTSGEPATPAFRKSFWVREGLCSAKLYTAGLGVYESYLNGQRIGRLQKDGCVQYEELKPGFTQRNLRQQYSSFDVTRMLSPGENVLGSVVTTGWWLRVGLLFRGKTLAYLAKLILRYADGSREIIATNTGWKAAHYPAYDGTGIFRGERFDATLDRSWLLPGYDDSPWPHAVRNEEFKGELTARKGVPVTVRKDLERRPKSITVYAGVTGAVDGACYGDVNRVGTYADGEPVSLVPGQTLLADFGQNAAGWEYMELTGSRGTVVTVRHGEWLNEPGGSISRGNDGPGGSMFTTSNRLAPALTVYTMAGGREHYHPTMTYYGFQYIEITANAPITVHKLRGQVLTCVCSDTATMATSDQAVNQLLSNITWGMYSNYQSVPTDCPQRDERHGWTGDAQIFAQAGTYLTQAQSFLGKYLQDIRDAQRRSDGAYPDIAPYTHDYGYHANKDGSYTYGEVGWGDAGILIPWHLYRMYGDTAVLRKHWASMRQYMDVYMASTDGDGSTSGSFDHLTPETKDKVPVGNLLGVAYYAWDALCMAEMAEALVEAEAASHYRCVYQKEKEIFCRRYVGADGRLLRYEQTALVYALYLDLLPDEASQKAVTEQLLSSIARYGDRMMTGFLGTSLILHTLTKAGRSDVAYTLLLQHGYPSWLYSVDQGATTMWERWDTYTYANGFGPAAMNSFNHYAYGAVAGWMYATVAGISPESPGFKRILLAPAFDSRLPRVSATYESVYGTITTSTDIRDGLIIYCATVPANTTATVRLPAVGRITVHGKPPDALCLETDGICHTSTQNGILQFHAVAGSFRFEMYQEEIL